MVTTGALDVPVTQVTPQNVTVAGKNDGESVTVTQAVYDMSNSQATLTLAQQESYEPYCKVTIDGYTYTLRTQEVLPEVPGAVSLRGVLPSVSGNSAEISVYNSTYETKTILIKGINSAGNEITAEITVEAESVGKTAVIGANIADYTWTVTAAE